MVTKGLFVVAREGTDSTEPKDNYDYDAEDDGYNISNQR